MEVRFKVHIQRIIYQQRQTQTVQAVTHQPRWCIKMFKANEYYRQTRHRNTSHIKEWNAWSFEILYRVYIVQGACLNNHSIKLQQLLCHQLRENAITAMIAASTPFPYHCSPAVTQWECLTAACPTLSNTLLVHQPTSLGWENLPVIVIIAAATEHLVTCNLCCLQQSQNAWVQQSCPKYTLSVLDWQSTDVLAPHHNAGKSRRHSFLLLKSSQCLWYQTFQTAISPDESPETSKSLCPADSALTA